MKRLTILALLVLYPAVAGAQSLEEKQKIRDAETSLSEQLNTTNKACGTALSAAVDWASFKGSLVDSKNEATAAGFCAMVLDGISQVCAQGDDEKKAVAAKMKSVKCTFDKSLKREGGKEGEYGLALGLKGSNLVPRYNFDVAYIEDTTKSWLMKNL